MTDPAHKRARAARPDPTNTSFREASAPDPRPDAGETRSGVHPPPAPGGAGSPFEPPLWVRVAKVDASGTSRSLGVGSLLDHLVVGEPFRVSTRGGYALVTTPVAALRVHGEDLVQARTAHATYELHRVDAPPDDAHAPSDVDSDFVTDVRPAMRSDDHVEATGTVALASAPTPGAGPFCAGALVQAIRLGDRGDADEYRSLGTGHLLDPVEVGGALRFALVDGASMVTSPVRTLERVAPGILRVSTANTVYQLELATELASKPEGESD